MKRFLALALALLLLTGCGSPAVTDPTHGDRTPTDPYEGYRVLSKADYLDKTASGFVAQLVGFLSGYEFVANADGSARIALPDDWYEMCNGPYADPNPHKKHTDKLQYNEKTGIWEIWNDDDYSIDILDQYLLRDMHNAVGTFSSRFITDGWVKYDVYDMGGGHRSAGAYGLMKKYSYLPFYSAAAEFGAKYSWNGEPYIGNETLGLVCPGMPATCDALASVFGSVTGEGDVALWARFFATLIAMAYFDTDIEGLIRACADAVFPATSNCRTIVDEVFANYELFPDDWRVAAPRLNRSCFERVAQKPDTNLGNNYINCAFILMGLLYGKGDYAETCKILSLAGQGGDSTTPVALTAVAVMNGMKNLPAVVNEKVWQDGKGVILNTKYPDLADGYQMFCAGLPARFTLSEIVDLYRENFEWILLENGGRMDEENYYIPQQTLGKLQSVALPNYGFEDGNLKNWDAAGAAVTKSMHVGDYAVELTGGEGERAVSRTVAGLEVGKTYRLGAFVTASAGAKAELYATDGTATVCADVYSQPDWVERRLYFTATAETMTVGFRLVDATNSKYTARADDFTLIRTDINEVAPVTVEGLKENDRVDTVLKLHVAGNQVTEKWLMVRYANEGSETVAIDVIVNGKQAGTAVASKTGKTTCASAANVLFIPVLCQEEGNSIRLTVSDQLFITDVKLVTLTERW